MSALTPGSDRVERENANVQAGGSLPFGFANDSQALPRPTTTPSVPRRTHITARRVALTRGRLTNLDHRILEAVARLNVASHKQLRELFYDDTPSAKRTARADLARLTNERILGRLERRVGGVRAGSDGYIYALDVVGQRIAHPDRRRYRPPWTPRPTQVAHALAVTELYVTLTAAQAPGTTVRTFHAEPAAWRSYSGPGGGRAHLKPDAFVICDAEDFEYRYFVEVDRATESTTRILAKSRDYVRYWQSGREQATTGLFPLVVWVVPDANRHAQLVSALSELPPEHWSLFVVTTASEAWRLLWPDHPHQPTREEDRS